MNKRTFLKSSAMLSLGAMAGLSAMGKTKESFPEIPLSGGAADDEDFWKQVRGMYNLNPAYINLENGYYCIQPQEILTKYQQHIREVNM